MAHEGEAVKRSLVREAWSGWDLALVFRMTRGIGRGLYEGTKRKDG